MRHLLNLSCILIDSSNKSQAHCLVSYANALPKPAKELALPTHGLTGTKHETPTHGIVHAGFRGFRAFVARKKSRCKLIGNRFVIPHDTIPSNVVCHNKNRTYEAIYYNNMFYFFDCFKFM